MAKRSTKPKSTTAMKHPHEDAKRAELRALKRVMRLQRAIDRAIRTVERLTVANDVALVHLARFIANRADDRALGQKLQHDEAAKG